MPHWYGPPAPHGSASPAPPGWAEHSGGVGAPYYYQPDPYFQSGPRPPSHPGTGIPVQQPPAGRTGPGFPAIPQPLVVAIALFPLAIIGIFVILGLSRSGGADSPAAAVTDLVDFAVDEDALGVASVLDPHEIEIFRPLAEEVAKRPKGAGLTARSGESVLSGVDADVSGLRVDAQDLRDGVARVDVTAGTLRLRINSDALNPSLREATESSGDLAGSAGKTIQLADIARDVGDDSSLRTYVVAVETDGRWYVSIAATIAEYAREAAGIPYSPGLKPNPGIGADSPEDAVRKLTATLSGTDLRAAVQLLPPDTYRALYDYTGVIEDWLAKNGDTDVGRLTVLGLLGGTPDHDDYYYDENTGDYVYEAKPDDPRVAGVKLRMNSLDITQEKLGDGRIRVTPTSGSLNVVDRHGDEETYTFSDRCITDPDGERSCVDDAETKLRRPDVSAVVVERNGRYFVDPLATAVDYLRQLAAQVTDEDVACYIAEARAESEDFETSQDYERADGRAERICTTAPLGADIRD